MASLKGETGDAKIAGVYGASTNNSDEAGPGVHGVSKAAGVLGESKTWHGVAGISQSTTGGVGVFGESEGTGAWGKSKTWHGVVGTSDSTTGGHGVHGEGDTGVAGIGRTWVGVYGETNGAISNGPAGVWGDGKEGGYGVKGHARAEGAAGVAGYHLANRGPGIYGQGAPAGLFNGDVHVTGDVQLTGADMAEDFELSDGINVEPGTVMILDGIGQVRSSEQPYDRRVAGVVSGGGDYRSAILLDRRDDINNRIPLALVGKVYCKVDASYGSIELGDLLTTSPTQGHAMKVDDSSKAFGAVLGKAMASLDTGIGLLPILVTLQ